MFCQTLVATLATLALLPATAAAAQNAWTTTALNFREGPGTYYPVIHYLTPAYQPPADQAPVRRTY